MVTTIAYIVSYIVKCHCQIPILYGISTIIDLHFIPNLSYQKKGNYAYAKIPGESYRENGHVKKRNAIYLGRVVDKENNVFFNKERGVFTYDVITGTYGEADHAFQGNLKNDHRKKANLILDFGDSYFIDSLIRTMHYDEVLASISYQNKDTLWAAMTRYYILSNKVNSHANTWYDGSFANVLYPEADIHSQRISKFLNELGKEETRRSYFKAHIKWLKDYVCNEAKMITAIQRVSYYVPRYSRKHCRRNNFIHYHNHSDRV